MKEFLKITKQTLTYEGTILNTDADFPKSCNSTAFTTNADFESLEYKQLQTDKIFKTK